MECGIRAEGLLEITGRLEADDEVVADEPVPPQAGALKQGCDRRLRGHVTHEAQVSTNRRHRSVVSACPVRKIKVRLGVQRARSTQVLPQAPEAPDAGPMWDAHDFADRPIVQDAREHGVHFRPPAKVHACLPGCHAVGTHEHHVDSASK